MQFCEYGWPGLNKQYLPVASELKVQDGMLLRGWRLIISDQRCCNVYTVGTNL